MPISEIRIQLIPTDDPVTDQTHKSALQIIKKLKHETTVATFDKLAEKYQEKYMDFDLYIDTYPANGDPLTDESGSTTHFSVVDRHGNMVAYTKIINHFFASGITTPGTGSVLNDQMDDFDKRPGQANSIAGGKRPLSSMSPTLMLKDGKPFATIGSPGGKRIISTVAMLISDLVDFDMDTQSAINTPKPSATRPIRNRK